MLHVLQFLVFSSFIWQKLVLLVRKCTSIISPKLCQIAPTCGRLPQVVEILPQLVSDSPNLWHCCPKLWQTPPSCGRSSPSCGNIAPSWGNLAPTWGIIRQPQVAADSPNLRQRAPSCGRRPQLAAGSPNLRRQPQLAADSPNLHQAAPRCGTQPQVGPPSTIHHMLSPPIFTTNSTTVRILLAQQCKWYYLDPWEHMKYSPNITLKGESCLHPHR
jgi:hypothetical protein